MARASETILSLQYLRAIAALMVVWHHARGQIAHIEAHFPSDFGAKGVDIFFVLSGFIMTATTQRTRVTPRRFLYRRVIRVVPLYWCLTLGMVGAIVVAPTLFRSAEATPETVVKSLLFIPHYSLSHPTEIWPLLVPGWSLNFEMYFYVVFAACLWLPERWRISVLIAFLSLSVVLGFLLDGNESPGLVTYTAPRLLEFVAGIILAVLLKKPSWPAAASLACMVGGGALLFVGPPGTNGMMIDLVGSTLCVIGALTSREQSRLFSTGLLLGDASYSIYLTHLFTLGIVRTVWQKLVPTAPDSPVHATCFLVVAMCVSAVVGVACYVVVEKPMLRWLRTSSGKQVASIHQVQQRQ